MRLSLSLLVLLAACRAKDELPVDSVEDEPIVDADGDGYAAAGDCDDEDPAINPGAEELCDGLDNDCDGEVDDGASDAPTWLADADGDGFGDEARATTACEAPEGHVAAGGDCDDGDPRFNPGAEETDCADPNDYNCDGSVGYADADGDGFPACEECNDADPAVNPGAAEVCNGLDDDCDALTDEGLTSTYFQDVDADGYGDEDFAVEACEAPEGHVADDTDCDDADPAVNPGAAEVCNGLDDDCDALIDDDDPGLDAASASTFYDDVDADGYGDPASATRACEAPSGAVADDSDCDDADNAVNPGAAEVCDGVDDDCDLAVDEGLLGAGAACAADDCLSILSDQPGAADGGYWVDFNGVATLAECDMLTDGGGWTRVFFDDFESGPDAGWSQQSTTSCGSFSTILGGYNIIANGTMSNTIDLQGLSHAELRATLYYVKLDSWDGETATVELDGSTVWSRSLYYYEGSEVCGWNRGYEGSYDERYAVDAAVAHAAATVTLTAGSTLNQDPGDESFGIDDVEIWVR